MSARIILLTSILFFIVSSARLVFGVRNNTICCKMVSRQEYREISHREIRSKSYFYFFTKKEYFTKINGSYHTVWEQECSSDKDNRTGTCRCNYGWSGDSCDERLYCTIAKSERSNFSETLDVNSELPASASITTDNRLPELTNYPCLQECHNHINSTDINSTRTGNTIYYFVPIDSPCNTAAAYLAFLKDYKYIIAGVIGIIISLVILFCIVCIVQKKRRARDAVPNEPLEAENDYGYEYVEIMLTKPSN